MGAYDQQQHVYAIICPVEKICTTALTMKINFFRYIPLNILICHRCIYIFRIFNISIYFDKKKNVNDIEQILNLLFLSRTAFWILHVVAFRFALSLSGLFIRWHLTICTSIHNYKWSPVWGQAFWGVDANQKWTNDS